MSSEAISFLRKQEGDSGTDDGLEDDDLIVHEDELVLRRHQLNPNSRLQRFLRTRSYKWANHVVFGGNLLLLLWILWGVLMVRSYCPDVPFSLLSKSIQYEDRVIDHRHDQPVPESVEKDWLTWDQGFTGEIFRVSKEEMQKSGVWFEDAIPLEHGGYLSGLGVMHELHCLAWLQQMYPSTNTSIFERGMHVIGHLDHCLHVLLRSAKCRPDLTVGGLYWESETAERHSGNSEKIQKCVKWDGVKAWLEPRLLDQTDGVLEGVLSPEGVVRHEPGSEGLD